MSEMEEQAVPVGDQQEDWLLLMDPEWEPAEDDEVPPIESVVGVWPLEGGGNVGRFHSNPVYRPCSEGSPTDLIDAVLRRMVSGAADPEQLRPLLRDAGFAMAMNGDGRPLVIPAPDDTLCVVVGTARQHCERVPAPLWQDVELAELAELLEEQYDVLFNPGGPASVRLVREFIRSASTMTDDEAMAAYRDLGCDSSGLDVIRWKMAASADDTPPGADGPSTRDA